MADNTHIEWTEATWNPITGCSLASPGCTNCYAMKLAGGRLANIPCRAGLTQQSKAGPVWTGEVRFNEHELTKPLRWKRPRMIFVCAHGDLFHENVPDHWIDRVFAVMALSPQHTFQVLTKRSGRMRGYFNHVDVEYRIDCVMNEIINERVDPLNRRSDDLRAIAPDLDETWPLPNVWLGVSVEDQQRRDRIVDLAQTLAAVRWISGEPLLEGLTLTDIPLNGGADEHGIQWLFDALTGEQYFLSQGFKHIGDGPDMQPLDWVVAGGESGKHARPMHPDWARALRDQCAAAGVPFFFKQWGEWELSLDREKDDPDWLADYSNNYVDRGRSRWLNIEGGRGFHGERFVVMRQVGKKRAGRLLDGVEHNGMPGDA